MLVAKGSAGAEGIVVGVAIVNGSSAPAALGATSAEP